MLFNEESASLTGKITLQTEETLLLLDAWTGRSQPWENGDTITFDGYQLTVVCTDRADAE